MPFARDEPVRRQAAARVRAQPVAGLRGHQHAAGSPDRPDPCPARGAGVTRGTAARAARNLPPSPARQRLRHPAKPAAGRGGGGLRVPCHQWVSTPNPALCYDGCSGFAPARCTDRGSKAGEPPLPGSPLQHAIRCRLSISALTMTDRLTPMPDAPVRPLRTGRAPAFAIALAPSLPQRPKRAMSPRRISAPPDSARFPA
ncbi:protein of unknown function [Cupriavidus taiwanensis]|uniref:Uncharacterized protein n=1 Tax=Cupriavidus taiwanensis TaxID=164546 RepID=A0A7Z7J732_9BURK|nr:protein of unknown function [Cupriavidus taiwanensis]SOZ03658.1 hypothetical protein CBM2597_A150100 [Cupriavidus taiwanensis]SPC07894.1 hypothetical protein CBM2594_A130097 [Cupriavidus taiwanensis]